MRDEVLVLGTSIRRDLSIDITDTELSRLFGHSGGWAQGMIARYMYQRYSENPLAGDRRRLVGSEREKKLVQFHLM
jgi:hypothetical protein